MLSKIDLMERTENTPEIRMESADRKTLIKKYFNGNYEGRDYECVIMNIYIYISLPDYTFTMAPLYPGTLIIF